MYFRNKYWSILLIVLFLIFSLPSGSNLTIIYARAIKYQTTTGTLVGSVVDQQNNPIAGAEVTVTNRSTGFRAGRQRTGSASRTAPTATISTARIRAPFAAMPSAFPRSYAWWRKSAISGRWSVAPLSVVVITSSEGRCRRSTESDQNS